MIFTSTKQAWGIWGSVVAILGAVLGAAMMTLLLTRPAASVMSMTPVSGLITLKAMAAESMPYEQAIANQNPTLIEFYADWCTTCQGMSATVDALHTQYGDRINFVMLDIDDPQWAGQISDFHASGVPQFTLLSSEHESVNTWVGKVPKSIFTTAFADVLNVVSDNALSSAISSVTPL